jgi:hypothetical protein
VGAKLGMKAPYWTRLAGGSAGSAVASVDDRRGTRV